MDEITGGLAPFESVWERVCPSGAGGTAGPELALSSRIAEKARSASAYSYLKGKMRGFSRTFAAVELDERRHLRKLQLEYFLLTGKTVLPEPDPPDFFGALSLLRDCYRAESEAAASYASAERSFPQLAPLFSRIAADDRRHAELLREIIAEILS